MKRFKTLIWAAMIAILVAMVALGGFVGGRLTAPPGKRPSQLAAYQQGKVSFCKLGQEDRMIACPHIRRIKVLPGGSIFMSHVCDSSRTRGFVELFGSSASDRQLFMAAVGALAGTLGAEKIDCDRPGHLLFRIGSK